MSADPKEFHVDSGTTSTQDVGLPAASYAAKLSRNPETFMTFTEAAVEVLKREGKPLHFRKIAEIAIRDSLLDHVGKIPEETMADQLSAHCKLPRTDRTIVAVQHATFALEEWGLPEDPLGLENLVEPPPADELPYRPKERHPIPARELARSSGREASRGRRREEGDEKRRRFPPPAEVAYEILSGAERPLPLRELAALGAERMLMPEAFVRDAGSLAAALREDNRRRESAGRKALFAIEGDLVSLGAVPEPGERPAPVVAVRAPSSPAEMRRTALAALRRRLRECDGPTIEYLVARLLEKTGHHEVKVAKRGRDSVVFTARRRMGLADVRHAVRVLRNGADVGRRDVSDVRRDLGHYGAQIGVLVTSGEAGREARGEATVAGQLPVLLIAGEAFAEAFADATLACRIVSIPEADEDFLLQAVEVAQREEVARKARRDERDRREGREGREERDGREDRDRPRERDRDRDRREDRRPRPETGTPEPSGEPSTPPVEDVVLEASRSEEATPAPSSLETAQVSALEPSLAPAVDDADEDGEDDGGEEDGPEATAPGGAAEPGKEGGPAGEGRRRRRRRRRRGGRGRGERRPEGEASASPGGAPGASAGVPDASPPAPQADPGNRGPPPASGSTEGS
jgi:ribonuclease E